MNLLTEHARELLGMPPEWDAYRFEAIGLTSTQPTKVFCVEGAVAPLKTRGKYKGNPNWAKRDRATVRTAYFTPDEHDTWKSGWELKTGKCAECTGSGQRNVGWSAADGAKFKPCEKCNATGKAK